MEKRGNKFAALIGSLRTTALAEAIPCRIQTVGKWKSSRGLPSPEMYDAIAKASGISVEAIAQAVADDKAARPKLPRGRAAHARRSVPPTTNA